MGELTMRMAAEATRLLQQARDARMQALGPEHPDTVAAKDALRLAFSLRQDLLHRRQQPDSLDGPRPPVSRVPSHRLEAPR